MAATCGNGYVFDKLLKKKKNVPQGGNCQTEVCVKMAVNTVHIDCSCVAAVVLVVLAVHELVPPTDTQTTGFCRKSTMKTTPSINRVTG